MSDRVLGLDPGMATTGYGIVEAAEDRVGRLVECGAIRTDPAHDTGRRLEALYDGVTQLIERHHPTVAAVESVFYGKNVRTTIALGQARGVILLCAARAGLEVAEFPPATVKKCVVGDGGAVKNQVGYMVRRLLNLKTAPTPSDAADACAIALTYVLSTRVRA